MPTVKDVHIDAAMTGISIAYRNEMYIAERIFRAIPGLSKQSDKFFKYQKGAWFRDEAGPRPPGSAARRGSYPVTNDTYFAEEIAFAEPVPDELRENADAPLNPDIDATEHATDKILLHKERRVAQLLLTPSNWASGHTEDADGKWAAGAGNTFIQSVEAGIEVVRKKTGRRPNILVMDATTLSQIKQEATVLDRIKYVERGVVTPMLLASLFGLEEVLIGDAIYSNAPEKADGSDFNGVEIWETNPGKGSAFLAYRPPSPGLRTPATGYFFPWRTRQVRRYRDEEKFHQDIVEAYENYDVKFTGNDMGYLWYDTHTT
jgi:hypothetical protein